MNKRDKDNLRFLLDKYEHGGERALQEWMDSIDRDEVEYAIELLVRYQTQKTHFDNIINRIFD